MTIKDIKNYIDNITFLITSRKRPFNRAMMKKSLNNIKVMLDALEIEQSIIIKNKQLPQRSDKIMTNGDKIKKMSNRELCKFLYEIDNDGDMVYIDGEWRNSYELLDWLDEEAEEDE